MINQSKHGKPFTTSPTNEHCANRPAFSTRTIQAMVRASLLLVISSVASTVSTVRKAAIHQDLNE